MLTAVAAEATKKRAELQPYILAALTMVTVLHAMAAVSRPVVGYVLSTMKVILIGVMIAQKVAATKVQEYLKDKIPKDVRTAMKLLGLVPDIVTYGCCRKCFAIYEADPAQPDDPFPHTCTHTSREHGRCNEPLVFERVIRAVPPGETGGSRWLPFRTYPYRKLQSWLAEFLLRPGVEKLVNESWAQPNSPDDWADIMDAPGIREFVGPDRKTFFSEQGPEIHLVFSLFVDWFNPHGNKNTGKSHSVGAIYMACLNLPPHLRYRPENIYLVAIIPGPQEPNVLQLNHLLRPLVDELERFWEHGVAFARTADRPLGCVVRVALIPLVCDLPAIRKTAGFGHYSSTHFCNFCRLLHENMNNVDRTTWPPAYSWTEHIRHAQDWRETQGQKRRDHFKLHGIRWSELLRLRYWDPTRFTLLDAMHNLFLGELRHHCLRIWGLKTADSRAKPTRAALHSPAQQMDQLRRIRRGLEAQSSGTIERIRRDYLIAVAKFNDILIPEGQRKAGIADALVDWVRVLCWSRATRLSAGLTRIKLGQKDARRHRIVPASTHTSPSHSRLSPCYGSARRGQRRIHAQCPSRTP